MAIADDISTAINGDIRWTGAAGQTYNVLAFLRYLGALADDAEASGDDLVDITTSTPADRSTDQIVALNSPFNIDDTLAEHLFDGSVSQNDGDDLYSGLEVVGSVVAGTEPMVLQDNQILPPYWGTGINADAALLIIMRILVKSRNGGADIDGKRVLVLGREYQDQYKEFPTTLGLASSVAAISTADDLNNAKSDATIEAFTDITNTEGFQELDIDGTGAAGQEFYSQWTKGSRTLNDLYERTKWISQRSHNADASGAQVGNDFVIDNGTILGQGQEFSARAQVEKLTEMVFSIKIAAGTPTGVLVAQLIDSDDASPAAPTGAVLATSEEVLASKITSSYADVIFRFNDNVSMVADQEYFAVITHAAGTAGNNFHVEGDTTGTDDGNRAELTGAWAGQAAEDLEFTVKSSPLIHGIAGEQFRGIDTEVVYDTESGGPFTEDEVIYWGSKFTYDGLSGSFVVGEYVQFQDEGTATVINGGKVLADSGTILTVALEDLSQPVVDNDDILGIDSAATAVVNVTITDDDKAGGEGLLLALDDNGTAGDFYYQLISGQSPVDNLAIEGRSSGATAAVNVTVTARVISPEYIGASTGTNLIGAYGLGVAPADVGSSDKFFDLANALRTPPNNVTFTVTGLVSGEDRVLVGPRTGSALEKAQLTTDVTLSSGTETLIQCSAAIPSDTPSTGTGSDNTRVRVELDTGVYRRVQYDSFAANDFTITTGPDDDWTGVNVSTQPKDVFIAYIDVLADATSEAYTAVYSSDRDLFVRVRDGGATPIKTFETSATFGSVSSSVAAIRTTDA